MSKGGKRLQAGWSPPTEKKGGKRLQAQQRKTLRKPRGVMAAVILLAVSAAMIAGVTFGWYDFFRDTQAGAVVLTSEGQLVSVDGFTLFSSSEATSTLPSGNTLTLKSYDSVFGRNEQTPVYILIPVTGEAVQEAGYTLQFSFDCGGSPLTGTVDEEIKIQPYFSNVAQLRCVVVSGTPTDYGDAQAQFSGVADTPVCFASFTVDSNSHALQLDPAPSKNNSVTLSAPGHSDTGVQYVLFELDYNFNLVTGFVNNYASGIAGRLDQSQNLEFNDKDHQETIVITVSAVSAA